MHIRLHSFFLLFVLCVPCNRVFAATDPDIERAKAQIVAQLLENQPDGDPRNTESQIAKQNQKEYVQNLLTKLQPDGSWSDIDYADKTRGAWKPALHTSRMIEMARIYADPNSPLYHDTALGKAIHSALGHWLQHKYTASNWWYNDIGTPTNLALFLLLFEKELTPEEKTNALKIVGRSQISSTGQNRVWIASNQLRKGLLTEDPQLVQTARDVIMKEVAIAPVVVVPKPAPTPKPLPGTKPASGPKPVLPSNEGIQADNSFHQHGALLQLGNYGLSFAIDIPAWADALRGTRWAIPSDQLGILRTYLLEGLRFVYWKNAMDISSCFRQILPRSPAEKYTVFVNTLGRMQRVDPSHAEDYKAAIESSRTEQTNAFVANKYFWRSDYMVDRRPGYYASVKMSSTRVAGFEACNGENQKGYHASDGTLFLHTRGGEYTEIFPVWDWRKLPGITAVQVEGALPLTIESNRSALAGGVSDGHDGAAAMECVHGGVSAKKSWFFLDGRIACLGAGISAATNLPVVTTLNQSLARGDVLVQQAGGQPKPLAKRAELTNVSWVLHDGIGYAFPSPVTATVGSAPQTGAWKDIFTADSTPPVTKDVFALWLDHGIQPKEASYAYVILPNSTPEQLEAFSKQPDVQILSNTPQLQAVQFGKLTMAFFYQPGQLGYAPDKTLAVNKPCVLLLRENGAEPTITVADPTQKEVSIGVTLNGKVLSIPLPQGVLAGKSTQSPMKAQGASL